jgi:hypothetical protein
VKPAITPEPELIALDVIADWLHYQGRDRKRSVRRCFKHHGIQLLKRDGRSVFATERLYQDLLLRMQQCSQSDGEARSTMRAARSVSVGKSERSTSTLRAAVNAKLRSPTSTASKPTFAPSSLTVLPGGRDV